MEKFEKGCTFVSGALSLNIFIWQVKLLELKAYQEGNDIIGDLLKSSRNTYGRQNYESLRGHQSQNYQTDKKDNLFSHLMK